MGGQQQIEVLGGLKMNKAYLKMTDSEYYRELERMRDHARVNEMYALSNAKKLATKAERKKWKKIVAAQDKIIADKDKIIAALEIEIAKLRKQLADLRTEADS
jgi:hypothetical protein